jgi:metal-responsive CopG/Arc/MetJ family transcriptional regulator
MDAALPPLTLALANEFGYFSNMETAVNLDDELLAEAKIFAKRSHRSLSEVVAEALHEKLSKSNGKTSTRQSVSSFNLELHPDIRRLTGLVPAHLDAETVYHEHLTRRHK